MNPVSNPAVQAINAVRGMNDILPAEVYQWQNVEKVINRVFTGYGYQEIRLPIIEKTELYKRTIGEGTDIVEKEMYSFLDRNAESMTLRPEGTAGCVRAVIQRNLLYHQTPKLWYSGPMYRYENPQKDRYRQFYQIGVEAFGLTGELIEAELLLMSHRLWRELGVAKYLTLQINSLGLPETRANYRADFVHFCQQHFAQLDDDSKRRLTSNPLRILDSKNPALQELLQQAPKITDYLDANTQQHLENLQELLTQAQIKFEINPRLVRGLDYYTGSVFEWVTNALGSQGTVCAGGRYDGLVAQLGGAATPAVGFALGMERLLSLLALDHPAQESVPDIYVILAGAEEEQQGILAAEQLRNALPRVSIMVNFSGGSFKNQFKRADKSGARYAVIIGEDELKGNMLTCKNLREERPQVRLAISELTNYLESELKSTVQA